MPDYPLIHYFSKYQYQSHPIDLIAGWVLFLFILYFLLKSNDEFYIPFTPSKYKMYQPPTLIRLLKHNEVQIIMVIKFFLFTYLRLRLIILLFIIIIYLRYLVQ